MPPFVLVVVVAIHLGEVIDVWSPFEARLAERMT